MQEKFLHNKKNLSDQVMEEIVSSLIEGEYKPGDKLPSEKVISELFGISRLTVREALKKLSIIGLIEIRHGEGSFVKKPQVQTYFKTILPLIILNDDIEDILEARFYIEKSSLELCIKKIDKGGIEKLKKIIKKMEEHVNNNQIEKYHATDIAFHLLIVKESGNKTFYAISQMLKDLVIKKIIKEAILTEEDCQVSLSKHKEIFNSIKEKDLSKAVMLIKEHLEDARHLAQKEKYV